MNCLKTQTQKVLNHDAAGKCPPAVKDRRKNK